jgi:cytoskeletal protein CcmA (bactofilin family)
MKFGNRKINSEEINVSKVTVLSLGFELTGDVLSKNDIRADGILHGNIRTDKKVVVGEKASIVGDILADQISISGEVIGDLYINGETTIYSTAKVSGKILTHQIFIHKGAILNTSIRTQSPENIQKEKETNKLQKKERASTNSEGNMPNTSYRN